MLLSLGFDGAVVRHAFADDHNLEVGSKFEIQTPQGNEVPLVVRGIYDPPAEELDALLGSVPLAQRAFDSAWIDERAGGIDQILNMFYVLLALSVSVSLFGMVNALALSVFERTRELGMLRAIGLTRRQMIIARWTASTSRSRCRWR